MGLPDKSLVCWFVDVEPSMLLNCSYTTFPHLGFESVIHNIKAEVSAGIMVPDLQTRNIPLEYL